MGDNGKPRKAGALADPCTTIVGDFLLLDGREGDGESPKEAGMDPVMRDRLVAALDDPNSGDSPLSRIMERSRRRSRNRSASLLIPTVTKGTANRIATMVRYVASFQASMATTVTTSLAVDRVVPIVDYGFLCRLCFVLC